MLNFVVALTHEARLFLPVLAYLFPIFWNGVISVYKNNGQSGAAKL